MHFLRFEDERVIALLTRNSIATYARSLASTFKKQTSSDKDRFAVDANWNLLQVWYAYEQAPRSVGLSWYGSQVVTLHLQLFRRCLRWSGFSWSRQRNKWRLQLLSVGLLNFPLVCFPYLLGVFLLSHVTGHFLPHQRCADMQLEGGQLVATSNEDSFQGVMLLLVWVHMSFTMCCLAAIVLDRLAAIETRLNNGQKAGSISPRSGLQMNIKPKIEAAAAEGKNIWNSAIYIHMHLVAI